MLALVCVLIRAVGQKPYTWPFHVASPQSSLGFLIAWQLGAKSENPESKVETVWHLYDLALEINVTSTLLSWLRQSQRCTEVQGGGTIGSTTSWEKC